MRVSTNLIQRDSLKSLQRQQSELHKIEMQLSTGRRMLTASDDPTGAALSLEIGKTLEIYKQYQTNISQAKSRLQLEETTLANVENVLQRARELSVQANNDALSSGAQGLSAELRELVDELLGLANTQDANGDYLFSGNTGHTKPFDKAGGGWGVPATFTYNGDQGEREIQISSGRSIADSHSGYDVFMKVPNGAGTGYQSIFKTLDDFAVAVENDTVSGADIDNIDAALESVLEKHADVGARLNAIESQEFANGDYILFMEQAVSDIRDLDFADAVSQLEVRMAGLDAAQKTYVKLQGLSLFNYI